MLLSEDRKHFSHNQLVTMLSCPYKYFLQYAEERDWDFVPSSVSFGGAIHESIKGFHKALQNGGVKDTSEYSEQFRSHFVLESR